jgi:hypothetical protein
MLYDIRFLITMLRICQEKVTLSPGYASCLPVVADALQANDGGYMFY